MWPGRSGRRMCVDTLCSWLLHAASQQALCKLRLWVGAGFWRARSASAKQDAPKCRGPGTLCDSCDSVLLSAVQVPDGPDGQTAELRAGDMMVIKYTTVSRLVQSGQVTLL